MYLHEANSPIAATTLARAGSPLRGLEEAKEDGIAVHEKLFDHDNSFSREEIPSGNRKGVITADSTD